MNTISIRDSDKLLRPAASAGTGRTFGLAAALAIFAQAFQASAAEPVAPPDEDLGPAIEVPTRSQLKSTGTPSLGPTTVVGGPWVFQGPGPSRFGQVENISPNNEVVGAVNAVAPHPTNPNILFVGGANGGVWKTLNATAASPNWRPLTDHLTSLSIGALAFDLLDPTFNTVWAGVGRFSSFGRAGGPRAGLQRTTNGGSTWTEVDGGGLLAGKNISGVVVRSNVVVISVNTSDAGGVGNSGIFRSTDFGATFTQVSTGNGALTGLPGGAAYDLAGDPSNLNVIYTALTQADTVGGVNGVYRSADRGATWTRVSNATIDALIDSASTSNMRMNVSPQGVFYIGIINSGLLEGVFRTANAGGVWQQMDIPATNENGTDVGINPNPKGDGDPGGQGSIHFSIAADPNNTNVVYVGGDRQPRTFGDTGGFPNSIGARDFSGRHFRGDASQPSGSQWVHITHSSSLGPVGGGTLSSSSPHADSRDMAFDAAGNLIEGDDGGVYKRTSPQSNAGDWFSINGNLGVAELHDVAYDANANVSVGGAQDTGTPRQIAAGNTPWTSVSTADGGDVALDLISTPGFSVQYSSFQNLGSFRRRTYDVNNVLIATATPALTLTNGIGPFLKLFVTPVRVNAVDGRRLIFGSSSNLYESFDQGNNISEVVLTNGISNKALAYGGRSGGVTNADVLYAGSSTRVFIRTNAGGLMLASATYPGSTPRDIALDPDDWRTAFVIDSDQVFTTTNAGGNWTEITGDLTGALDFRAVKFITLDGARAIAVGTLNGVFACYLTAPTTWFKLGSALPSAPVYDLDTHPGDNVLVAGTLGRGAWKIPLGLSASNDVVLTLLDSPDPVFVGQSVTYALTVSNTGPGSATGVIVTNVLPAGVNFFSATSSQGVCVNNSGTVVCTVGAIAGSTSVSLIIVGTTTATGVITNHASVVRSETDSNANNNSASVTTTVAPPTLTQSFTNSGPITIPDVGAGSPYPSTIAVAGVAGTVVKVTARVRNLDHTYPDDVDLLLVSPTGQKVMLLSDAGGEWEVTGVSLTFDDTAAATVPDDDEVLTGTYRPTDYNAGDTMPGPAPAGPYGTSLGVFTNLNPNGVWQLFAADDAGSDEGSIMGGWELNFTVIGAIATPNHFTWDAISGPQFVGAPFPITVRAKNAANQTLSNFTGVVALSAQQGSNLLFSANFESGLQGFTIDNSFGRGNGLWHLSTGRGADAGHSPSSSLYYGAGEGPAGGGNYNTGTNEGVVVSPSIDLTLASGAITLTFNYLLQTENSSEYDLALVEISTNNGVSYSPVAGTSLPGGSLTNNTSGVWRQAAVDLSAFAGWPIRLRFRFDTVDGVFNEFEGWYLDDVAISSTQSGLRITPVFTGNFVAGVWSGNVTALEGATGVTLKADDGMGLTGTSNPFDVLTPMLSIARVGNQSVISWSALLSAFSLKSTANLNPAPVWTAVTNTPVNVGGRLTVTNTLGGPQRFYRLEK